MKVSKLILKPLITEKSNALNEIGKYIFEVSLSANKGSIKQELKKVFGVDVVSIQSSILPGKLRRQGRTPRFKKTAKSKKMMVQLKKGQKIDLMTKEK